jgi:hypothetical protein
MRMLWRLDRKLAGENASCSNRQASVFTFSFAERTSSTLSS